jgi:hypothetical protein
MTATLADSDLPVLYRYRGEAISWCESECWVTLGAVGLLAYINPPPDYGAIAARQKVRR